MLPPAARLKPWKSFRIACLAIAVAVEVIAVRMRAGGDSDSGTMPSAGGDAFGPLGWLDHRSVYGQEAYPEPFLVDDSDLETDEARLDWLHTRATNQHSDLLTGEVEKGFGLLTLEIEVPYERDSSTSIDPASGRSTTTLTQGMANVDLGARLPVFEHVSGDGMIDVTGGVAVEVGVPTNSPVSANTEVVPKLFADLAIGPHFTIQSIFGYSMLYGGGDDGGLDTFEYGFVFAYNVDHRQLPLPGVLRLVPIFELSGETELNKAGAGEDSLVGDLGFRLNLKSLGGVEPRLGFAFVFPIDSGARADVRSGFVTSLVFEY
jgi:hypothetical protein